MLVGAMDAIVNVLRTSTGECSALAAKALSTFVFACSELAIRTTGLPEVLVRMLRSRDTRVPPIACGVLLRITAKSQAFCKKLVGANALPAIVHLMKLDDKLLSRSAFMASIGVLQDQSAIRPAIEAGALPCFV